MSWTKTEQYPDQKIWTQALGADVDVCLWGDGNHDVTRAWVRRNGRCVCQGKGKTTREALRDLARILRQSSDADHAERVSRMRGPRGNPRLTPSVDASFDPIYVWCHLCHASVGQPCRPPLDEGRYHKRRWTSRRHQADWVATLHARAHGALCKAGSDGICCECGQLVDRLRAIPELLQGSEQQGGR